MNSNMRVATWTACGLAVALWASCGGSGGSLGSNGSGGGSLDLVEMTHGFGVLVPYQILEADAQGQPTSKVVSIRTLADLYDNLSDQNPVLPSTEWPTAALLPNGDAGNQYVALRFTAALDVDSILSRSPGAQAASGLTGALVVTAFDPASNTTSLVRGRAFVGGRTYAGAPSGSPPSLDLQTWVRVDAAGKPIAADVGGAFPGLGFPGTQSAAGFAGASQLVGADTFVFVADTDNDLTTHETFPAGRQLRISASTAVLSKNHRPLARAVLGASTVGADVIQPEVAQTPPPNARPDTIPSMNATDVDPLTSVQVRYTEPVQPLSVGSAPTEQVPQLSSAISLTFGPSTSVVNVPFTARPVSVYDLSTYMLEPAFHFPGSGPDQFQCGVFNRVTVSFNNAQTADLRANLNTQPVQTQFETGEGPGLVNAPVTPDAIYAVRNALEKPGLSVVDLNGFGGSTGNPTHDPNAMVEGNSHFPDNPNLRVQGALLIPPMKMPICTIDGGSAGVFTLTRDSALNDLLVRAPVITTVGDMAMGWALDVVYNNGQEASGCQAGGGNVCAIRGKKNIAGMFGAASSQSSIVPINLPGLPPTQIAVTSAGGANLVSWAPSPNPPPLVFPPLCLSPYIGGQEPTSVEAIQNPPPITPFGLGLTNVLTPGDAFGNPATNARPSGLLASQQNSFFEGPSPVRALNVCQEYMMRQQVGHFLYVIDSARREVVVLNSNRFTVIERIPVADPTDLAMGPNLDFLAVTNRAADSVVFIDVQPSSSTFHQVVRTVPVGRGPAGIAWDPGNEDVLVCNEGDNSVSIIGVASLSVRKTVASQLNQPFDVAIQQRSFNFGFFRNVYFAYILNRNGDMAVFESGPNGVNGWGYDDIIGVPPFTFEKPKRIVLDIARPSGGVWILHENKLGLDGSPTNVAGGALTHLVVESSLAGQLPLNVQSLAIPNFRDMSFRVDASLGPDVLTGVPMDMAMDDLVNLGGGPNQMPIQGAGSALESNGKSTVRLGGQGTIVGAKRPQFLFLAVPTSTEGPGVIDVIDIASAGFQRVDTNVYRPGVQSIPAAGITGLMDYWRQ